MRKFFLCFVAPFCTTVILNAEVLMATRPAQPEGSQRIHHNENHTHSCLFYTAMFGLLALVHICLYYALHSFYFCFLRFGLVLLVVTLEKLLGSPLPANPVARLSVQTGTHFWPILSRTHCTGTDCCLLAWFLLSSNNSAGPSGRLYLFHLKKQMTARFLRVFVKEKKSWKCLSYWHLNYAANLSMKL